MLIGKLVINVGGDAREKDTGINLGEFQTKIDHNYYKQIRMIMGTYIIKLTIKHTSVGIIIDKNNQLFLKGFVLWVGV